MRRDNEETEAEYLESQSDEGAYDDYDYDNERRDRRTCKFCGESALHWMQYYGKWRLFDWKGKLHNCLREEAWHYE